MKNTKEKISFEGQRYPMWFNYKLDGSGFIVNIAHTKDVMGIEVQSGHPQLGRFKIIEVLESREKPKNGDTNYFDPAAKFYTVMAVQAD